MGSSPADEFTPDDLLKARQIWIDRGCSRSYVNRCVQTIIRCFKWAVTKRRVPAQSWQELAAVEPLRKGRPGARETPKVKSVPEEVVTPVLAFLPPTVADMVRLQMLTGCRPNEVTRLTPGQIDRGGDVWKYTPEVHKCAWLEKPRTVFIGPQAQLVIAKYLFRDADEPCFQTAQGKQFARGGYRQVIRRTIEKLNIGIGPKLPHWTPNQLRHFKATQLREQQDLEAARAILGHSSETTTLIYAELKDQAAVELTRNTG